MTRATVTKKAKKAASAAQKAVDKVGKSLPGLPKPPPAPELTAREHLTHQMLIMLQSNAALSFNITRMMQSPPEATDVDGKKLWHTVLENCTANAPSIEKLVGQISAAFIK